MTVGWFNPDRPLPDEEDKEKKGSRGRWPWKLTATPAQQKPCGKAWLGF
jgi:hypothetical protein